MYTRPEGLALGCKAKDRISGFTGVVIAITEWLNGCQRVTIQPQELFEGKPVDSHTFDAEQIEVLQSRPASEATAKKTGGPSIAPGQRRDPGR